ncbi:MAG TPA: cyclic nucleotide-binding domain-containing protein [Chthoniobacterales bacterium]|nr:cyclic nucleotide-binding domain-containing protein [Chthoniobacterales bacterium]
MITALETRDDLDADVAAHPFLLGLNEHHVRLLADCSVRVHFERDQTLFREGETANRFYLIERGEVVLESASGGDEQIVIDTVGDGDLLGWSWLFPPYTWHFTARATKPTTAIFFYGTILREYCEKDHTLGYELLKRMSEVMTRRLQLARARLLKTYAAAGSSAIAFCR